MITKELALRYMELTQTKQMADRMAEGFANAFMTAFEDTSSNLPQALELFKKEFTDFCMDTTMQTLMSVLDTDETEMALAFYSSEVYRSILAKTSSVYAEAEAEAQREMPKIMDRVFALAFPLKEIEED